MSATRPDAVVPLAIQPGPPPGEPEVARQFAGLVDADTDAQKAEKLKVLTAAQAEYQRQEYQYRLHRVEQALRERRSYLNLREKYAPKTYQFVTGSVCFLFGMLLLTGLFNVLLRALGGMSEVPFLSDAVLIALISGVTVNVLAVFLVVIRNLFPPVNEENGGPDDPGAGK